MFAGFDQLCGLPVVVGPDPQIATARKDAFGRPFIHVDPGAMRNWTTSRRFVLAHECAHHRLGHTSPLGEQQRFFGGTRQQELEADCWAARALRQHGLTADITRTVLEHASQGHFAANGYPSGQERAHNIQACAGGGQQAGSQQAGGQQPRCRDVTRRCDHAAHPAGDQRPCQHQGLAHPRGDLVPCQHACPGAWGPVPCHPPGDLVPCQHPGRQHPFDVVPCQHPAHPSGDVERVCR